MHCLSLLKTIWHYMIVIALNDGMHFVEPVMLIGFIRVGDEDTM